MADAAAMLKDLAQPWRPGEFVKDVITRIAPLAGLTQTRASDIWYGKARRVEDSEFARIADALDKKNKRALWNDITRLEAEIARIKSIIAVSNQDYGQPSGLSDRRGLRVASEIDRSTTGPR